MPLSGVLAIALIVISRGERGVVLWLRVGAALCIAVTVITTLAVNVPINSRTAIWQPTNDSSEWYEMRRQWHAFQGVRGGLFALAFVLLTIAFVIVPSGGDGLVQPLATRSAQEHVARDTVRG
jgi:uncharacterized membrane protein